MATLLGLAEKLEKRVQPSDDFYKFSIPELQEEISEAIVHLDPELTPEDLNKWQEVLVIYKARSSCYYTLAHKHAENMRVKIENDEYHGQQPHQHYLKLAEEYENKFLSNMDIQVSTVTRTQTGTGRKAPFYPGDTP